jgi:hypothetical protein
VFVLAFTGTYEWSRGSGWRQLTGDNRRDQPTLDALKRTLSDPEWVSDPEGKARRIAMECVREIRGDDNV